MSNHTYAVRNAFIAGAAFFSILIVSTESRAQSPTDCQTELGVTSGYTSLTNGATTTKQKGVDEWDGEVIKIRTSKPGVLTLAGAGTGSQSSLYTDAASGPYPLLDSAQLGTNLRNLQVVVSAGDHCIQVAPPPGATGDLEVQATFTDVCPLGTADDHGDSFLCATPMTVGGGSVSGQISSGTPSDGDMFTFTLGSSATVTIESTGSTTDVEGELYDQDGVLLDSDDDSGTYSNFKIIYPSLPAGKYYVRVKGANGSYGLGAS
ncbi:MAG TPA: PPC domain-containing protein [Thermoanaerobaculia bacterium]